MSRYEEKFVLELDLIECDLLLTALVDARGVAAAAGDPERVAALAALAERVEFLDPILEEVSDVG